GAFCLPGDAAAAGAGGVANDVHDVGATHAGGDGGYLVVRAASCEGLQERLLAPTAQGRRRRQLLGEAGDVALERRDLAVALAQLLVLLAKLSSPQPGGLQLHAGSEL